MFLDSRLPSARRISTPTALAVLIFVLGLGIGTTLGPITTGRGEVPPASGLRPSDKTAVNNPTPAWRGEPVVLRQSYPAEVLRVLDGDTFEARGHLSPGLEITSKVRLRGIDAPELKARCTGERTKTEAARDALRRILDQGEVGIAKVTLDKYGGRVVADASTAATPSVSTALYDAGLARATTAAGATAGAPNSFPR